MLGILIGIGIRMTQASEIHDMLLELRKRVLQEKLLASQMLLPLLAERAESQEAVLNTAISAIGTKYGIAICDLCERSFEYKDGHRICPSCQGIEEDG